MDYSASQKLVDYTGIWIRCIPTKVHDFDMFLPLIAVIAWQYFQSNGFSVHYDYQTSKLRCFSWKHE